MLSGLEEAHQTAIENEEDAPKLFPLYPNPSLGWRFVPLDIRVLSTFFNDIPRPRRPVDYAETAYRIFNFEHIKIYR